MLVYYFNQILYLGISGLSSADLLESFLKGKSIKFQFLIMPFDSKCFVYSQTLLFYEVTHDP